MTGEHEIRARLHELVPEPLDAGDWLRVLADAGREDVSEPSRGRRSRRISLVLALAVLTGSVLAASPALGLREAIVRLTGEAPAVELSPGAESELQALADAGPNDIRCSNDGASLYCEPVPGEDVLPALRNGETLYGRHVYSDVSRAADTGIPLFEADELLCEPPGADGTMLCRAAGVVQPTVSPGQKMLVAYRRYHVTFGPTGNTIGRHGERTVPLVTAQD